MRLKSIFPCLYCASGNELYIDVDRNRMKEAKPSTFLNLCAVCGGAKLFITERALSNDEVQRAKEWLTRRCRLSQTLI